jgi:hypothetical protein
MCLIVYSCNRNNRNDRNEQTDINASYIIDLDKTEKQGIINLSYIFKNVNAIILEDHDDAIIGNIDAIQVLDNYIFVLDKRKSKKLFIFDKNGKYIKQVGRIGVGSEEYLGIMDFCINSEKHEVYLLDDWSKKICGYNLDNGAYIGSIRLKKDYSYKYIAYYEQSFYLSVYDYDENKSDDLLIKINPKTNQSEEYLSANQYNAGWNQMFFSMWNFFVFKNEYPKYVELFMNTVFSIKKNGIYPYLSINHKDWVKKEDILSKKELARIDIVQTNELRKKGKAFLIHNYMEWKNIIYFEYDYGFSSFPVLYDKKTGKTNHYKTFKNDILLNHGTKNNIFLFVNSNAAYDCDPYFITSLKNNEIELVSDVDKREELMNLDEERVVIFEYVFK